MKNLLLILGVLVISAQAFSQPDPDEMDDTRRNKIETLKRAYISEKLDYQRGGKVLACLQ
jgi:hypothetical protein